MNTFVSNLEIKKQELLTEIDTIEIRKAEGIKSAYTELEVIEKKIEDAQIILGEKETRMNKLNIISLFWIFKRKIQKCIAGKKNRVVYK